MGGDLTIIAGDIILFYLHDAQLWVRSSRKQKQFAYAGGKEVTVHSIFQCPRRIVAGQTQLYISCPRGRTRGKGCSSALRKILLYCILPSVATTHSCGSGAAVYSLPTRAGAEAGEVEPAGAGAGAGAAGVRCAQCGRRYSNASNLRQHVRLIHEAQPVVCATCGRCFKTPLYLRRHTLAQHPARLKPPPIPALRPAHR